MPELHLPPPPPPPANITPFVQVLGIERTIRFPLAYSGAELAFSANPQDRTELVRVFGRDAVIALSGVPTLSRRIPLAKQWLAVYLRSQGQSVSQIARTAQDRCRETPGTTTAHSQPRETG